MYCDIDASRYPDIINNETKTAIVGTYGCTEGDSTTIKNYYTSDAWKSAMDYAYRFRALGYVKPDGSEASSASSTSDWTKEIGIIIAYGSDEKTQGNMYTEKDKDQGGREFAGKAVTVQNLTTTSILWGVSYTSKNVKAAATLLNLMWTDYRILNDLIYGVEGKSYVVVEPTTDYTPEGIGSMDYPEGLNADTVPYNMSLNSGIFGDEFLMLRGSTMSSDTRKYMQDVINNAWVVPTFGFSPSNDEVSVQAASVSNVVSQYYDALRYGDLDPEVYNPQFLQALEEAGINDVLESYQEQINAWLTLK
jgi:putative aldouronate transport system substrate-binding protein